MKIFRLRAPQCSRCPANMSFTSSWNLATNVARHTYICQYCGFERKVDAEAVVEVIEE